MATKPRGGGAKELIDRATKKRTFFAASLNYVVICRKFEKYKRVCNMK